MITQFHVQNYKALRYVTLDLTPIHVLVGPNDSGKTSILEALAALCRSVDHRLVEAFVGTWSGRELVWRKSPASNVSLSVKLIDGDEKLEYTLVSSFLDAHPFVKAETESLQIGKCEFDLDLAGPDSWLFRKRKGDQFPTLEESLSGTRDNRSEIAEKLSDAMTGIHLYRFDPRMLSLSVAPDSLRQFRMDATGFGLAMVLDDILGDDRNRFDELEKHFQRLFPDLESLKLKLEMGYKAPVDPPDQITMLKRADGKGLYFRFKGSEQDVPASQVSDGMLLVLAYLAILYLPKPPRVLLIEEPENGIHPRRLQEVLKILRELVEGQSHTQVILTTHSPYAVDEFKPEEVTVCFKQADGSVSVKRLSESKAVNEQKDIFTLGEIWAAEGDEALVNSETVSEENAG